MKRKLLLLMLAISIFSGSLFASDKFYQQGDTIFSFSAGPTIPTFIYLWNTDDGLLIGNDTHLDIGGYGAINFDYFVSESTSLGFEIGYDFNYDYSKTIYTNVPLVATYKYYPIQTGKWDVPLTLGAGVSFNGYDSDILLSLFAEAKAGVTYFINENWGFGIEGGLNIVPQINYSSTKSEGNGIISYSPITLKVSYRK